MTYVLTLYTIILRLKLVPAFGFKIRLCKETACKTALGKGRASRGEARKPKWEREGGSRHLPKCPETPGWGSRAGGNGSGTVVCPPGTQWH